MQVYEGSIGPNHEVMQRRQVTNCAMGRPHHTTNADGYAILSAFAAWRDLRLNKGVMRTVN